MTILWSINDRNGAALPLNDKEIHLYYICERGRFEAEIEIQDNNVVVWHFYGKKQKTLGNYSLTLEIIQSQGKRTIKKDICNAFTLVSRGCSEICPSGEAHIKEGGEITLATDLDIYRISPIIPQIGDNDNWWVDGNDTGKPARGEKGDVVDAAYMEFDVEDDMNLYLTFISTNDQLDLDFTINEEGYLTVDK